MRPITAFRDLRGLGASALNGVGHLDRDALAIDASGAVYRPASQDRGLILIGAQPGNVRPNAIYRIGDTYSRAFGGRAQWSRIGRRRLDRDP